MRLTRKRRRRTLQFATLVFKKYVFSIVLGSEIVDSLDSNFKVHLDLSFSNSVHYILHFCIFLINCSRFKHRKIIEHNYQAICGHGPHYENE